MKNYKYLWIIPAFAAAIMMLFAFGGYGGYPSGAPAGYTGSPADGKNCTNCHGGTPSNVNGWITSDIPAEGYTPGNTYNITVTVTGSGKKGFEVSPQNLSGTFLGTLTAGTGNHLTGSGKYVTQSSSQTGDPATWTFTWLAPQAGTGEVTFYGAFAINTSTTKLSTLIVPEHSIGTGVDPTATSGAAVVAAPNPSTGKFHVSFREQPGNAAVTFRVYDLNGKLALSRTAGPPELSGNAVIDLTGYNSGVYLLEVTCGNGRQVVRLIKSAE